MCSIISRLMPTSRFGPAVAELRKTSLAQCALECSTLADEIEDGHIGFIIKRALDDARSRQFSIAGMINNNVASAWPWAARLRARGSMGSDRKIRGCRR